MHREMTNATVTPISRSFRMAGGEQTPDEFVDVLGALADLAVKARSQRMRLEGLTHGNADTRISSAIEHLADLERHASEVGAEAARVHNELRHARLI
jgi:hypothetical protein